MIGMVAVKSIAITLLHRDTPASGDHWSLSFLFITSHMSYIL